MQNADFGFYFLQFCVLLFKFSLLFAVESVVREAIGEFLVFREECFVSGGAAEGLVEGCCERSAGEHFFHDALGDFGEVVFHHAVDELPDVAGFYAAPSVRTVCSVRKIHAEYGQEFRPVDEGVFGVFRCAGEDFGEFCGIKILQEFAVFLHRRGNLRWHGFRTTCIACSIGRLCAFRVPAFCCLRGGQKLSVGDGLECRDFHFRDGDVGVRAFLNIHKADFDGPAVEAGDGAAAVQEKVVEQMFRVVRGDGLLYFVKNLTVVFVVGVRLFRDDLSRDFGDFVLVVAVDFDSGILQSAVFAVQGTGCSQRLPGGAAKAGVWRRGVPRIRCRHQRTSSSACFADLPNRGLCS